MTSETRPNKIELLEAFHTLYGDFWIWEKVDSNWKKWVLYSDAVAWQKIHCNMRGLFKSEIVLDVEHPERIKQIIDSLKNENYSFAVWSTGSRGYHIHMIFPELKNYDEDDVKLIRKIFIRKYKCDESKQTGLIAIEGEYHYKGTGRCKKLVYNHDSGENKLPLDILKNFEDAKAKAESWKDVESTKLTRKWIESDPVIRYCLTHEIPPGIGRYDVVCKNLAIGMAVAGLSYDEIRGLAGRILANMPKRDWGIDSFMGWVRSARNGKFKNYNRRELLKWFEEHMGDLDD